MQLKMHFESKQACNPLRTELLGFSRLRVIVHDAVNCFPRPVYCLRSCDLWSSREEMILFRHKNQPNRMSVR